MDCSAQFNNINYLHTNQTKATSYKISVEKLSVCWKGQILHKSDCSCLVIFSYFFFHPLYPQAPSCAGLRRLEKERGPHFLVYIISWRRANEPVLAQGFYPVSVYNYCNLSPLSVNLWWGCWLLFVCLFDYLYGLVVHRPAGRWEVFCWRVIDDMTLSRCKPSGIYVSDTLLSV